MMRNNLLQSKPKVYERMSSEREAYETQSCQLLKVHDSANALEKVSKKIGKEVETIIEHLYNKMRQCQLNDTVTEIFDFKKYDVDVSICDYQHSRTAIVRINRRSVKKKIRDEIKSFLLIKLGK